MLTLTAPVRAIAAGMRRLTIGYRPLIESAIPEHAGMLSPDSIMTGSAVREIHEKAFARAAALAANPAVPELHPWRFGETQRTLFAAELGDVEEAAVFARECAERENANNVVVISTSRRRAMEITRYLKEIDVRGIPLGLPDRDQERRADDELVEATRFDREELSPSPDVLVISESEAMGAMLRPVVAELRRRDECRIAYTHARRITPEPDSVRVARATAANALASAVSAESEVAGLDLVEQGLVRALQRRRLVETILACKEIERLLESSRPRLLVIGNDRVWTGQLLVQAAHRRGIPVLCVQDGLAADVPAWWLRTADHTACNGTHLRDLLVRRGVPTDRLTVTGQPRNDSLHARASELDTAAARSALGLASSGLQLLVALQGSHDEEYVRSVLREASRVPGATIILRTHPWQSPELVSSVVRQLELPNVLLRPDDDSAVAVRAADVVISQYSTMLVEAAALGTPAVAVTLSRRRNPIDLSDEGIAVPARRRKEILPAIQAALNRSPAETAAAQAAAERLIGPFDGGATARVADLISELLARSPADPGTASGGEFARTAQMPGHP